MKLTGRILALTLTILPMVAAAQLRQDGKIVANVPFEFTVGNQVMPAGTVTVLRTSANNQGLLIRDASAKQAVMLMARQDEIKSTPKEYTLVFHQYGDRCFLSAIKLAGSRIAYRLPENKAEAELRAQSGTKNEQTIVASLQ